MRVCHLKSISNCRQGKEQLRQAQGNMGVVTVAVWMQSMAEDGERRGRKDLIYACGASRSQLPSHMCSFPGSTGLPSSRPAFIYLITSPLLLLPL